MLLPMPDLPIKNKKFLLVEIWNDMRDDVVEGAEEPHTPKGPHTGNDGRERLSSTADFPIWRGGAGRRSRRPIGAGQGSDARPFANRERDKSLDI